MRKYWELWKDALAAWAALVIVIEIITLPCGMDDIIEKLLSQYKLCFLLSVFFPYLMALPLEIWPNWWTKLRRLKLACVCIGLALILLIAYIIFRQTFSTWLHLLTIPLALGTIAIVYTFIPAQRQPIQPEQLPNKAQEIKKSSRESKPKRAKLINPAAVREILSALGDWIFEWWKMWKNILALLATISALSYTLADLIFHFNTTQIGQFVAKYSELALIMFGGLFVITLIIYLIKIVWRNRRSRCKTK